jgi:hypothetical protein
MSEVVKSFFGVVTVHDEVVGSDRVGRRGPSVFVHMAKKDEVFVFYDMEMRNTETEDGIEGKLILEIDLLSKNHSHIQDIKKNVTDICMKGFGLTSEKKELIKKESSIASRFANTLKDELDQRNPIDNDLYDKIKNKEDRDILIELRKRGSVLGSDLGDLSVGQTSREDINKSLDYFSGEEFELVNKRKAIVCRENEEIIFLMEDGQEPKDVEDFECPKCTNKIKDEKIIPYYGRTDKLDDLLDGSRWMPLFVKQQFVNAGVDENLIMTEVKYEQDEIDVLVLYKKYAFIIEVKDRSVNLNDAYKLSAKTSRLESIFEELASDRSIIFEQNEGWLFSSKGASDNIEFVPIVISTEDVADDAIDLLEETKSASKILEKCEDKLEKFVDELIRSIDDSFASERLSRLTSSGQSDSISSHIAEVIHNSALLMQDDN